jgi:hypothetical protein
MGDRGVIEGGERLVYHHYRSECYGRKRPLYVLVLPSLSATRMRQI